MQTFQEQFELQVDEKPNGAVIRVNNVFGCMIRVCSIPKELVFDEQGEVRSFIDITYPKQPKPKNRRLSRLGEKFKK